MLTKACYQRGSGVLVKCRSFNYLWCIRTGNGFDSPRRIASLNRYSTLKKTQMIDTIQQIKETEWGLCVELKEGVTIDDNNVMPTIDFIIKELKKIEKKNVFMDASRVDRKVTTLKFLYVSELIQREKRNLRFAFFAPQLANKEESKVMETFSFNRGVFLQYFEDKDTAMNWLLK
jgi:hypothetical protein